MFTDSYKLNKDAYNALKKIREAKTPVSETTSIDRKKFNFVTNEFDQDKFDNKVKLDSFVYNKLFEGLAQEDKEDVSVIISEMITDVREIYRFINIEPKTLGYKSLTVNSSVNELVKESRKVIDDFLNTEYYSLTVNQRNSRYKKPALDMAYNIVLEEKIDINDAVKHSFKTLIYEKLIDNLNFPYMAKYKISEVLEDNMYSDFFDINKLNSLLESFNAKNRKLSRILSAI
jgi:hypothetical protein